MGTTVVLAQFRFDRVYRGGNRRLAGVPAARWSSGAAHQGSFAGGRAARCRHDHAPTSWPTTSSRTCCICTWAAKTHAAVPRRFGSLDVRPGDRLLLASDGLTGVVPDKDLAQILGTVDDPQRAAVMLKDLALANDSKDNVTCLIIHAVAHEDSGSAASRGDEAGGRG